MFLSISVSLVSGCLSIIFPNDIGSARSPGEDLGGGVRDIVGKPSGRRPELEEVEDPGE
jgi:hypothetical protein